MTGLAPKLEQRLRQFLLEHGLESLDPGDLAWALTHRSWAVESASPVDNERLEYLGDALLSALAAEFLFERHPAATEGLLSKLRARLVSGDELGRQAIELGLDYRMMLGLGERGTGGARRLSILGSAAEAIVAIVYLRAGWPAARAFARRHLLAPLAQRLGEDELQGDYKTALQEFTQGRWKLLPEYLRLAEEGPPHDRRFTVAIQLQTRELARASGSRVKQAENEAARLALEILRAENPDPPEPDR